MKAIDVDAPLSPWRVAAYVRWRGLDEALHRAADPGASGYPDAAKALREARRLISAGYGIQAPRLFYSGARIERTWACLHDAERRMIDLVDAATLSELLPGLRDDVERFVPEGEEQRRALAEIDSVPKVAGNLWGSQRKKLRALAAQVNNKSDLYWREVRAFRNHLVLVSALLFVALAVLAVIPMIDSSLVSLCVSPEAPETEPLCPVGDQAGAVDIALIELLGVVGGLLAAILPLRNAERVPGPYGVAVMQVVLKGITGAGAAFVGILLLQGELLSGLKPQSHAQLLAYAVFFGFAQHVLTRLVDQRANEIAKGGQGAEPA